ncbi:hypothetical protein SAMD00019534_107380 [Acytostelium subglobosum LB1]|uniref:hypothetical protein n=1 Tax=Acytostelium subglobosum LB1 TaxID=1410327 RepID=UPI000644921F|nr:hypothetical protein SAMD00019534_107380 [Acytostelium subglobosum LB1]GAM27562.1 hypothetical protein SAMD00019534_107380 [Acytostelium subglobosum LB1]|eukprot:XP_012749627.1 hypothetical protein SAMD00019534_107380 [Acytostelium subglobosum LB1]
MERAIPSLSSSSLLSSSLPPNSLFALFNTLSMSKEQQQHGVGGGSTNSSSVTQQQSQQQQSQQHQDAPSMMDTKEEDRECANIIMEIDKGIRSPNLGDQVESILFYAHLIKYHPTPLVVTSSIIKLADIFRTSNNIVKYRILKVFQECSQEIHRISNIDEVLKRIHSVILSNDTVARALALRVLGSVPLLIADKLYIHHSIRSCMQTHDQVEANANYFIMDKLCEISPLFSDSIIEKINSIIQAIETPPLTKLKYTRLFRHMHHNHLISNQSRAMLIGLLDLYPSVVPVTLILDTMTELASKHLLHVNDHITFLMNYVLQDPRLKVKVTGLKCLQRLAKMSPHSIFPFNDIFGLLDDDQVSDTIKYHCLLLLSHLSSIQYKSILDDKQKYTITLMQFTTHDNSMLSDRSVEIITNLLLEDQSNDQSLVLQFIERICHILRDKYSTNTSSSLSKHSKTLSSIIKLLRQYPSYSGAVTSTIISLFGKVSDDTIEHLIHCISIYIPFSKSSMHPHFDKIISFLGETVSQQGNPKIIVSMIISIFRSYDEHIQLMTDVVDALLPQIEAICQLPNMQWCTYQLAQHAQKHGFHLVAATIYRHLLTKVSSEYNYFWLKSLLSFVTIEHNISSNGSRRGSNILDPMDTGTGTGSGVPSMSSLLTQLNTTLISLKASSIQERSLSFQENFITLRERYLYNLLNIKLLLSQYFTLSNITPRASTLLQSRIQSFQTMSKQYSQLMPLSHSTRQSLQRQQQPDHNHHWNESRSIMECYSIALTCLEQSAVGRALRDTRCIECASSSINNISLKTPPPVIISNSSAIPLTS